MLRHHLRMALRAITSRPGFAAINIGGLALGLAGCLMVLSYIRYERGWDAWLPEHERVFQVQTTWREPGQPMSRSQYSPYPVRATLAAGFPEIEALTVYRTGPAPVQRDGEPIFLKSASVDPSFFRIFRLRFLHGSPASALADTRTIVLTATQALAQFGTVDVVGRTLSVGAGDGRQDYRIGGVLADLPKNSSLRFDMLFRHDAAQTAGWVADAFSWGGMLQAHFVMLRQPEDAARINAALPAWERRAVAPVTVGGRLLALERMMDLKLTPIVDVHLGEAQDGTLAPGGDPRTLTTFALVAALTLVMALINFVNLSAARGLTRAREMALRKLLGAGRRGLIAQMLVESLVTVAIAMLLALSLVEVATPWVANATGAALAANYLGPSGMLLPAAGLFVLTVLAGGIYPALYVSRFQPATILRANHGAVETPGGQRVRLALVLLQFAAAIGFVACTWVIQRQTNFLATLDPGFRREGLIQLDAAWRFAGDDAEFRAASAELMRTPGVVAIGRTNLALAGSNRSQMPARGPRGDDVSMGIYAADPGFFTAMQMRLLAGRLHTDARGEDRIVRSDGGAEAKNRAVNVVLNSAAAQRLGLGSPEAAVGRSFGLSVDKDLIPATVIGVIGDTRLRGARDPLEPIAFLYDPARTSQVLIRYAGADPATVMAGVKRVWRRFEPEIPFQARFSEDILAETYAAERARGALFAGFSLLAIGIATLGLYGLAAFVTQRRTKEIGIRKVLGARVHHIVRLLVWQFSKPVVAANLLAWPIAWWAMRDWLNGFDARIALTPTPFALAGLLALAIAVFTVAGHAFRVARLNPIHALRYE
jgi:putative ABC transport system permease protein